MSGAGSGVPEVAALELAHALEAGETLQVVDLRQPALVAAGAIEGLGAGRFHALPGTALLRRRSLEGTGIAPGVPVVVVCGHGNSSRAVTRHLNELGCQARSLRGGMASWMSLVIPRALQPPPGLDGLVQLDRVGKGALGYLLVRAGEALVVDPPRDASAYLEAARAAGARIVGVADTHVHADYVSGAAALARRLDVPYHLHPADAVYPYDGTPGRIPFHAVGDGDVLRFGDAALTVRHTPGHTEGSATYLFGDELALTGDFLFLGSIGRPDLAGRTREWAARLWESVVRAKREWPPRTLVLPAHYGPADARRPDRVVAAPFASLLESNAALQFGDREAFLAWVEAQAAPFPESYRTIKAVNVGLHAPDEREVEVLEMGRNECALGGA